jgi:steroid delta-isomerase-like uncharacterized protein
MSAEENKAVVRRWVEEAYNKGNVAVADAIYAPDYVLHDLTAPVRGPEALKQFATMYRTAFPDLRITLEDMIAEGDTVVWRYTARGTQHGELTGLPPTGKPVTVTGIVISRFAGGRWAEDWHSQDTLGMLQQLGAFPAPAAGQP